MQQLDNFIQISGAPVGGIFWDILMFLFAIFDFLFGWI